MVICPSITSFPFLCNYLLKFVMFDFDISHVTSVSWPSCKQILTPRLIHFVDTILPNSLSRPFLELREILYQHDAPQYSFSFADRQIPFILKEINNNNNNTNKIGID